MSNRVMHVAKYLLVGGLLVSLLVGVLPAHGHSDDEPELAQLGYLGGFTDCGMVSGDYGYLGQGGHFTVVDLSGSEIEQVAAVGLPEP